MRSFNLTSIGASHIKAGKECQDFSLSEDHDSYSLAISCDGHGGDNYFRSAFGSRFAAQAASACIAELMRDLDGEEPSNPESMLVQLEKSIITQWNTLVWNHFDAHPFSEEEFSGISDSRKAKLVSGKSIESTYGTTLIALVGTKSFWFGIQIGDGKCVRVCTDGTLDQPIPVNDKCFLNSTTSICDENAIDDFRHIFIQEYPVALFCGSDGIDDSFVTDEQLYKLYSTVARSFGNRNYDEAFTELEDYLPRLSAKGSGDDVSIAGLIEQEQVKNVLGAEEPAPAPNEGMGQMVGRRTESDEVPSTLDAESTEDIPATHTDEARLSTNAEATDNSSVESDNLTNDSKTERLSKETLIQANRPPSSTNIDEELTSTVASSTEEVSGSEDSAALEVSSTELTVALDVPVQESFDCRDSDCFNASDIKEENHE